MGASVGVSKQSKKEKKEERSQGHCCNCCLSGGHDFMCFATLADLAATSAGSARGNLTFTRRPLYLVESSIACENKPLISHLEGRSCVKLHRHGEDKLPNLKLSIRARKRIIVTLNGVSMAVGLGVSQSADLCFKIISRVHREKSKYPVSSSLDSAICQMNN